MFLQSAVNGVLGPLQKISTFFTVLFLVMTRKITPHSGEKEERERERERERQAVCMCVRVCLCVCV